jgi:hypothetical protein
MKKLQIVGLALVAIFAFSALVASAASATQWLAKGAAIATAQATTTEGEILIEDMGAFSKPQILCSGLFVGTVGPGTADKINMIEDLEVPAKLAESGVKAIMNCTFEAKGACEGTLAEVEPVNLPWTTELALSGTTFVDKITSTNAGYKVICKTILGTLEDTCTGPTGSEVTNGTACEVLGSFVESETITPPANCTTGGAKEGLTISENGPGKIKLTSGEALTVSE